MKQVLAMCDKVDAFEIAAFYKTLNYISRLAHFVGSIILHSYTHGAN